MRKSFDPTGPVQGNSEKYFCYKEAWARIKRAIEQDFFIEAVAIEESIITDRIASYLRDQNNPPQEGLKNVLDGWEKEQPHEYGDLREEAHAWRKLRNTAIHAIVKSGDINTFLEKAKDAAQSGEPLVRKIEKWREKQKVKG